MRIDFIIPVGPGHEKQFRFAAETIRRAARLSPGPFSDVSIQVVDDTKGELGRSAARNLGVRRAIQEGADWLFFLDADDYFDIMGLAKFEERWFIEYDAIWGEIWTREFGRRPGQRWPFAYRDLLYDAPMRGLQIGHYIRAEIARENPFHESMDCGEDFEYYLRLWNPISGIRCVKVEKRFFAHARLRTPSSIGKRSATPQEWVTITNNLQSIARLRYENADRYPGSERDHA